MGPPGPARAPRPRSSPTHYGIPAISTGDIFRANVSANTALGVEAKRYMEAGEYVPDEVTNAMVRTASAWRLPARVPARRLPTHAGPGRRARQDARRLRRCPSTPSWSSPPTRTSWSSASCQRAQLEGRADDTEDVIRRRQEVYAEQTAPLIAVYRDRGLLVEVDGMGEIDVVTHKIFLAIDGKAG